MDNYQRQEIHPSHAGSEREKGAPGRLSRPRAGAMKRPGPRRTSWRQGLPAALWIIICLMLLAAGAAQAGETLLENLEYQVDALVFKDVARIRITLKNLEPGRYLAEFLGEPKGALKKLKGERREFYQTEMVWRQGRLMPSVYREESWRTGKRNLNEYRFDYDKGVVELWQRKDDKEPLVRKWETALKGPMFDYLSAFYNCRLGVLGPIKDGQTIKVTAIPYPKNENIEVGIGPETQEGRKIMVSINNEGFKSWKGVIHGYLDGKIVPRQAWSPVLIFGKIIANLQPGSKTLQKGLPEAAGP